MKKRLYIVTTIMAFVLCVSILVIGVYAALNSQSFGIKNSINFKGEGENLKFKLESTILGSTYGDAQAAPKNIINYTYEDAYTSDFKWERNLNVDTKNGDYEKVHLTYVFEITNTSDDQGLQIKIENSDTFVLNSTYLTQNFYYLNTAHPKIESTEFKVDMNDESLTLQTFSSSENIIEVQPQETKTVYMQLRYASGYYGDKIVEQDVNMLITIVAVE